MIDWAGKVAAWSGAASAASGTLAGVIAAEAKPLRGWPDAGFVVLMIIAVGAFLLLLATGLAALWAAWRSRHRDTGSSQAADDGAVLGIGGATLVANMSAADTDDIEPTRAGPAITDRWHHTSDGLKVPGLMNLTHVSVFHPGYSGRQAQDAPPSVKIAIRMGCQPIDRTASSTELRAKFGSFLESAAVLQFIAALTTVEPGASWKPMAGNGIRTLEAVLSAHQDPLEGVPVAVAEFLPPTAGEAMYGRDERTASLLLYVEPRTADGQVPDPADLTAWFERFRLALAVPTAFDAFLAGGLGLGTLGDPPAEIGVWLQSYQPLTVMVATGDLHSLPCASPSNQFIGWAYAFPDGQPVATVARDLLAQLCDYSLRLDNFEPCLAEIAASAGDAAANVEPEPVTPRPDLPRLRTLSLEGSAMRARLPDQQHSGLAVLPSDLITRFSTWKNEVAELLKPWPECRAQFLGKPAYGIVIFPLAKRCTEIEHHTRVLERLLPALEQDESGSIR